MIPINRASPILHVLYLDLKYPHTHCQSRYLHPSVRDQISLTAFHFRCLIQFSQLHSIRSMDHLKVGGFSLIFLMSCTCWSMSVYQNHLQSFTVMFGLLVGKESFQGFQSHQVQGFINLVFRMTNNVIRHMREVSNKISLQKIPLS